MRKIIFIYCLLVAVATQAQEQIGLRVDNYAGIHGVLLNPSHNITSLFRWDVNLVAMGFSAHSNYGYIENSNVLHAFRNADHFVLRKDLENSPKPTDLVADFNNNKKLKYLTLFANGMGPSFMVKLRNGHTFGLFTNARMVFSTHDIPAILNFNTFSETSFNQFLKVDGFKISTMVWSEVGFNYAAKIDTDDGKIGLGINLKFINANEAMYLNSKRNTPSAQLPGDTILFQSPHLKYGITNSNLEGEDVGIQNNGFGVGVDLGFTYVYEGDEDNYKWKIGASLLDLGQIELSRNAEEHDLNTDTLIVFSSTQFQSTTNRNRIRLLSEIALGDSTASLVSSSFRLGLPGALSIQGDYMVVPHFFVNGIWVQRIPMGANSLRRNNVVAITPRFEHRWFAGALPIVFTNYQKLGFGASFRIAFLTIGSDDIGSFIGKRNLDSTDFYVALKINPFNMGLNLGGGGGGRRSRKKVKCYEF